jgi:DeoR/GlpR family transcriptional regulator of sugar metabolism
MKTRKAMIEASKGVYHPGDPEKFGKASFVFLGAFYRVDAIATDKGMRGRLEVLGAGLIAAW